MSFYDKYLNFNDSESESLIKRFSMKRNEIIASSVALNEPDFKFALSEFLSNMKDGLDVNQNLQNFQFSDFKSNFKSNLKAITSNFSVLNVICPYSSLFSLKPQQFDTFESSIKYNNPVFVKPTEILLEPMVMPIKPEEPVIVPTVARAETKVVEIEPTPVLNIEENIHPVDAYAENNELYLKELSSEMQEKTRKLIAYANENGYEIKITSGLRTLAEQQELIKRDERNQTNYAAKGKSHHLTGSAIDIRVYKNGKKLYDEFTDIVAYAKKELGLRWGGNFVNSPYEPWHFDCA